MTGLVIPLPGVDLAPLVGGRRHRAPKREPFHPDYPWAWAATALMGPNRVKVRYVVDESATCNLVSRARLDEVECPLPDGITIKGRWCSAYSYTLTQPFDGGGTVSIDAFMAPLRDPSIDMFLCKPPFRTPDNVLTFPTRAGADVKPRKHGATARQRG